MASAPCSRWMVAEAMLSLRRAGPGVVAAKTGIPEVIVRRVLEELVREGLVSRAGEEYSVEEPVELALYAVGAGADPRRISDYLDWRSFEDYVARALSMYNYRVYRGVRLKPPKGLEADVIGVGGLYAVVIDCKHWSPRTTHLSRLREEAARHLERMRRLSLRLDEAGIEARPMVGALVVLVDPGIRVLGGVAVVPVAVLHDFLRHLEYYVDELGLSVVEPPG